MAGGDVIRWLAPERVYLRAGDTLFAQGRPVTAVYPLREGGIKRVYDSPLGWRQVTAFFLPGDVPGLEPNEAPAHGAHAVALQDSVCCVVPVEALRAHMEAPRLRAGVLDALRRMAARERELLVAIGSMKAAQRLAMLLLDLASEQDRRGAADGALRLAMTRHDMASYLGLTLETVSRLLSRFASVGLITVRHRLLRIIDRSGLAAVHADPDRVSLRDPAAR
ncbi:Crp/Fnr family transcriptional regulator [Cupriavidus campinensis]